LCFAQAIEEGYQTGGTHQLEVKTGHHHDLAGTTSQIGITFVSPLYTAALGPSEEGTVTLLDYAIVLNSSLEE
jgi:hypothetical protein